MRNRLLITAAALLLATGAAKASPVGVATASWYGPGLYGNSLACGGTLTTRTWGVAHKTLRCGTRVRICLRGRCATLPVVDRGPFVAGRDFDVTAAAARYLGLHGVETVRYHVK